MARRYVVGLIMTALLFNIFSDVLTPGLSRVHAVKITDNILSAFVGSNLNGASHYDMLNNGLIEDAVRDCHAGGTRWSDVRMQDVLAALGDVIADTAVDPEDPLKTIKINPWTEESEESPGSPFTPGVDYNSQPMNSEYTLGQLIIDYVRSMETLAMDFSDEEILDMYEQLAGGDTGDPIIDYDALVELMRSAAQAGKTGGYADMPGNDVLDYSDMVSYSNFIKNRGTPLPGGYLFIGTWIINAQNLNATFYRAAVQSMSDYDQQIDLYKSELAGNNWRNIAGATGLEYILPISETVLDKEIKDCWVSVFVGEDGIPVKAKTVTKDYGGDGVDIFNITDPYDIEKLPELKSLKMQFDAKLVDPNNGKSEMYIYNRIEEVFNRDGKLERNADMDRDCKYILEIAGQTGIAFYAADPWNCNSTTCFIEQTHSCSGIGLSCTGGWTVPAWRFQESGAGFLESLERAVSLYLSGRRTSKFNYRWGYYNGGYWPAADWDQQERLIRGSISWTNERKWRDDVEGFGGIEALRSRIWNFQDMWAHYSCIRDDVTDDLDIKLEGIKGLYTALRATGTSEDKELADEAMLLAEKVDAARRARAYENLVDNENHNYVVGPVLNLLYTLITTGESHVGNRFKLYYPNDTFAPVDSITEAVESAITGCQDAYIKYSGMSLTNGNTITQQLEYDLSTYVIDNAPAGLAGVRSQLRDLVDLENITNSVIAHKSRELNLLTQLLSVGDTKFQTYLHASVNDDYKEAVADPATTQSTLDEILKDQKAGVNGVASELQRFIKARSLRLSTEDAIAYILERIDWAEDQRVGISTDAFQSYAGEALDEHIRWLKDLLATIKEGGEILDEAGELEAQKAELQTQYLNALDNNNLKEAEELGRKIEDTQKALDDANAEKNKMAMSGTSAGERANAEVSNTPKAVADKIVDKILEDIPEGIYPGDDTIQALEDLGSPGLEPIYEALVRHEAPSSVIHRVEAALVNRTESPFIYEYDGPDANSGGNGAGTGLGPDGTGDGNNNNGGNNGNVDGNNNNGDGDNGNGGGPGGGGSGNGDTSGHGNGDGDGNNGGNGGNGSGNDHNTGDGEGSGNNGGVGGEGGTGNNGNPTPPEIPDFGPGTGLGPEDFDDAIKDAFGKEFGALSAGDQAAVIAALSDFAKAREDKAAYDYATDLLNDLLLEKCPFIYRQYVSDYSREYVSLAAVDKCRRYTRFRMVQKDFKVTMSQLVTGSASYVFEIGSRDVNKNNSETDKMTVAAVSQTDESIRGSKTAKYAYIDEGCSGKYLYCTCAYIPGTEWAILITPQVDKKIAQLLDRLDLEADGE